MKELQESGSETLHCTEALHCSLLGIVNRSF